LPALRVGHARELHQPHRARPCTFQDAHVTLREPLAAVRLHSAFHLFEVRQALFGRDAARYAQVVDQIDTHQIPPSEIRYRNDNRRSSWANRFAIGAPMPQTVTGASLEGWGGSCWLSSNSDYR